MLWSTVNFLATHVSFSDNDPIKYNAVYILYGSSMKHGQPEALSQSGYTEAKSTFLSYVMASGNFINKVAHMSYLKLEFHTFRYII